MVRDEEDEGRCLFQVLPGHYCSGRHPKQQQQFALTPQELRLREQSESLEELSISPTSHSHRNSLAISIREIFGKEEDHSPESARSSADQEFQTDRLFRISV